MLHCQRKNCNPLELSGRLYHQKEERLSWTLSVVSRWKCTEKRTRRKGSSWANSVRFWLKAAGQGEQTLRVLSKLNEQDSCWTWTWTGEMLMPRMRPSPRGSLLGPRHIKCGNFFCSFWRIIWKIYQNVGHQARICKLFHVTVCFNYPLGRWSTYFSGTNLKHIIGKEEKYLMETPLMMGLRKFEIYYLWVK